MIAVCTEDLAWVDAYAHRFDLVTVYDKCSHTREGPLYAFSSGNVIVRTIPNVGSFDNAALTYIIDRWETLPDTVEELHTRQIGWARAQAESLTEYFVRIGRIDAVVDGSWPIR